MILKSRFTKDEKTQETERKKAICKKCEFNSLNADEIIFDKKLLKWLSDLLSRVTGNKDKDVLGNCLGCASCSVYYKILVGDLCPKNKWKINKNK
jgi:hypothetical protein